MFKKLFSTKGQVSMEIGILVASAITVAAVASYYYVFNIKESNPEGPGKTGHNISIMFGNKSNDAAAAINKLNISNL